MKLIRILHDSRPTPPTKHQVVLSHADRRTLRRLVAVGTAPARALARARILLKADAAPAGPGWTDDQIRAALDVSAATIVRVRRAYGHVGLSAAIQRRPPGTSRPRKLDGRQEAHLVALACSEAPGGRARWRLRLLADELVRLEVVAAIAHETVRRTLQKTTSSRG